jgi:hypothetical protein
MDYETPTLEMIGEASELIQAYVGPRTDGDGYAYSQGLTGSPQQE